MPRTARSLISWLAPLTLGALVCSLLWLVGLPELGWLGFVVAAFAWPTLCHATGDRRPAPGLDPARGQQR